MKMHLISIVVNGQSYSRFVQCQTNERGQVQLTEQQLASVFPALAELNRGKTYSIG